jgi:HK97 family phage portal protein
MASFFDRFKGILNKNAQKTNEAFNRAIYNYLGDTIVWNPENDDTYINKGYRYNSTIYSIVNLITKAATTIPFQIYQVEKQNDLKRYKALTSGEFNPQAIHNAKLIQKNSMIELEGTELHELLERPNPAQSYNTWLSEIIAYGNLTGNRYIWGISPDSGSNAGKYRELYVLPSQSMEIVSGGIFNPVKEYTLEYNGTIRIDAQQVCHIKDFNPYYDGTGSHLYGMSPLKAGLRSLDANNEALTTGVRYLQNQTARGVLMSDEGDINEVQAKQLKEKFRQQYQGSDNAGDVVLSSKKLSWINFGLNASDLSLLEQYNASIKDLCNIYNVPVQLLNNTDSSTYNNMKEAKKALYQNAVIPEMLKIRDELNRWLTPQFGNNLFIDFDFTVIPELQEEMDKVVDQMSKAWWITPNEKRSAMSFGADDENEQMDQYYIPANLLPLSNEVDIPQPTELNFDFEGMLKSEEKAKVSDKVKVALKRKADEHNDEVGNVKSKRTTPGVLSDVYVRGIGAYRTNPSSVRPNVSSPEQWAMARVNSFLFALRNGKFRSGKHDQDLLPSGHPMSSKKKETKAKVPNLTDAYTTQEEAEERARELGGSGSHSHTYDGETIYMPFESHEEYENALEEDKYNKKQDSFNDYPQSATNNAKRMLEWREKYGRDVVRGGTEIGWKRANQLANRESISLDTVKRINSFLARHEENAKIDPKFKDEPWRDKGYVAYNLWGGKAMVSWAKRTANQDD